MTHQPPVPEAAQSPYPLQPAAHNDGAKLVATPAPSPDAELPLGLSTLAGIGAAFIGSAALAGWYFRRGKQPAKPATSTRKTVTQRQAPAKTKAPAARKSSTRKSSDPALVAAGEPYEVSYFARKHKISTAQARDIIKQAGPSRAKANELAKEAKA